MTKNSLTQSLPNSDKGLAWLMAEGDSMKGTFSAGDPLQVDISVNRFMGDGLYVFQVEDVRYVKRLQSVPGKGLAVISSNPNYKTWYITPEMDVQIVGHVVKVFKGQTV